MAAAPRFHMQPTRQTKRSGKDERSNPNSRGCTSHHGTFRRPDRRRRHFRRRRRLSPHQAVPGHELRRARSAGELRRHLAHPPLSRHPLRQRPLHLRLSLQAVDRRADRHRRRDPELHGRGDRRERPRPPHPLPPPHHLGAAGRARTISGPSTPSRTDTGEAVRFTANFLWMCQGYYRHSEGYTPEWAGMDRVQGPRSSIRRPGPRTSTTAASASS